MSILAYDAGVVDGIATEQARILNLLADGSPVWDSPLGTQEALRQAIRGETNFETYLDGQLKDPNVREAYEKAVGELPQYHCPDCDDYDCLHCYCVNEPNCNACNDFKKGEME